MYSELSRGLYRVVYFVLSLQYVGNVVKISGGGLQSQDILRRFQKVKFSCHPGEYEWSSSKGSNLLCESSRGLVGLTPYISHIERKPRKLFPRSIAEENLAGDFLELAQVKGELAAVKKELALMKEGSHAKNVRGVGPDCAGWSALKRGRKEKLRFWWAPQLFFLSSLPPPFIAPPIHRG